MADSKPQIDAPAQETIESESRSSTIDGWRLYVMVFALCTTLLLSTLETTIVSTSLVSSTNAVHGFESRDWVVTSYLLTYTGFLIIYAKFSDLFRPKTTAISAVLIFVIFSAACAGANSITELIVLRAFQGIGGSGIYAMVMVIATKFIDWKKGAKYMAIISSVMALASLLGPILGGAINDHGQWRWVFLLNVPTGIVAILLLIVTLPSDTKGDIRQVLQGLKKKLSWTSLGRLDIMGAFLLLASSTLVVFALEEGGTRFPWTSVAIIAALALAALTLIAFVLWEIALEKRQGKQEPIFPMHLLKDRVLAGMMLNAFFVGFPFVAVIVNIPQRYQAVNNTTPLQAGLYMLPMLLLSPLASGMSAFLISRLRVPPFHVLFAASILQTVGVGLMSSLPTTPGPVPNAQYGYEAIMGLGFGLGLSTLLILAQLLVAEKSRPVVMGALTQVRVLAGTVGLAICATILNNHVRSNLADVLENDQLLQISGSLSSISELSSDQQVLVRVAFAEGYQRQMQLLTGLSGAALLATMMVMHPRTVKRMSGDDIESARTRGSQRNETG